MRRPLDGVRVIELPAIGPVPFAAMMLADFGADVVRVDRPDTRIGNPRFDVLHRGRRSIVIDLKRRSGADVVLRLIEKADVVIEGWRPGVAERLGVGPDDCKAVNPDLVYARMTGYGQDGPYASEPGHDVNYLALSGVLHHMGRAEDTPVFPINLLGDFGGGGMVLAFGIMCALRVAEAGGGGQVVDSSMLEGVALLSAHLHGLRAKGDWRDERGTNSFDSGSHFYEIYETADHRFVSLGSLEPKFYRALLDALELAGEELPDQLDATAWPDMKERFRAIFRTRTRDEWCRLLEGREVCFAPVLTMGEAPDHPHLSARGSFLEVDGVCQPSPAPRLGRTPAGVRRPPPRAGEHTEEILVEYGLADEEVETLISEGAVS